MKRFGKIVSLILAAVLICGCGKPRQPEQEQKPEQTAEVLFPERMEEELTEQIRVKAEFVYPESCKHGKGAEVQLKEELFWDKDETIAELLLRDMESANAYIHDAGSIKYKIHEGTKTNEILNITDENYLTYATGQASYIQNVLSSDARFDSYNGDRYQEKTDLAFMPQKEAWEKVRGVLDELGVEISEEMTCYVMEHEVMEEEEAAAIAEAQEMDMKVPEAKAQWTEEDDCYYFAARTAWQGYPVLPPVMGEGYDENNVTVIYDKNGIQALSIDGFYPLEMKNEIELQSPEAAVRKLEEYFGNIISSDTYEVQKVTLCQKVVHMDTEKRTAEIVPVWECSVMVQSKDFPDDGYLQKIYFHAGTLAVV